MNTCKLIFSPDLNITAKQFVDLWNTEISSQQLAKAQLLEGTAHQFSFLSPEDAMVLLSFANTAGVESVKETSQRLLSSCLRRQTANTDTPPTLEMFEKVLHDGTKIIILMMPETVC